LYFILAFFCSFKTGLEMSAFEKTNCFHDGNGKDLGFLVQVHFLLRVFPFFLKKETIVALLW